MRRRQAAALLVLLLPLAATATGGSGTLQATADATTEAAPATDAAGAGQPADPPPRAVAATPAGTRSGLEIYRKFRAGLAQPQCAPGASARWRQHFAHVPAQIASGSGDTLPMFGYVVDALHEAYLPTEFALIPFVKSGYRPGARSSSGPAGLWQFIAITARNHEVPILPGYDGRLSPVDSTAAAVRYLKTLHGMFAGDWKLAVMAYNAGEYRILGALRRDGQRPANADTERLAVPDITRAYVRKLHALSCLLAEMEGEERWMRALDRPVPLLAPVAVASGSRDLDGHARRTGVDAGLLRRLNPALREGFPRSRGGLLVLSPTPAQASPSARLPGEGLAAAPAAARSGDGDGDISDAVAMAVEPEPPPRTHVVVRGESAWTIARRHGIAVNQLLAWNRLGTGAVLQPGMVLSIDPPR